LQEVVDDDIAQGPDRVVKAAAVLDAEGLSHRYLHARDVAAIPDRLEHRVGEAQVEKLLQPHLAEEVVDAVELVLGEMLVKLRGELSRRCEIVPERLLDDHPGRRRKRVSVSEAGDRRREERRRNLEVVDRRASSADGFRHALEGRRIREVAADVGQPLGEASEDLRVGVLAGCGYRVIGVFAQALDCPVVRGDADDRAVQQSACFQTVEREERHLSRQVSGDAEDHQDVCLLAHLSPPSRRSAIPVRSSRTIRSPASAVMSADPIAVGTTSTSSAPTPCSWLASVRTAHMSSAAPRPPGSGVPVPGATDGSSTSMSIERNTGPRPTMPTVRTTTSSIESVRMSSLNIVVMPLSRCQVNSCSPGQ